ncbi:hypothetical protein OEIGOIKO_05761 [Streptomyces chrestomyceticus JCM 4735]|uniref:Uncharacterized protein n=3 Tax=Streptomyces TaxID=1883 RepID=A0A7U9KZY3_9ACTN|nr:hypothetical protein OEIGOIKO_05761 [Streptomyces chrestomyceticus JCM 4735]
MAGMGPAPKPNARRRNATVAMTKLPAGGRKGAPPKWPLPDDVVTVAKRDMAQRQADELELALLEPELTGRARSAAQRKLDAAQTAATVLGKQLETQARTEGELWAELWATPQAVAWERLGWTREVAQYVRWKVRAEMGDLDASKEARQLGDRLGLTPLAMLRLRWEVATDEVGEQRQERSARPARSARARLKVVDPEAAAGGDGAVAGS